MRRRSSPLHRTLDQELVALLRGASLECLVCGEFVMHARGGGVFCPECGSQLARREARSQDGLELHRAGRVTAAALREPAVEESPDTTGQDAGASQAAKADGKWNRKETASGASPETPAVRVKRWGKSPPASRRRGG